MLRCDCVFGRARAIPARRAIKWKTRRPIYAAKVGIRQHARRHARTNPLRFLAFAFVTGCRRRDEIAIKQPLPRKPIGAIDWNFIRRPFAKKHRLFTPSPAVVGAGTFHAATRTGRLKASAARAGFGVGSGVYIAVAWASIKTSAGDARGVERVATALDFVLPRTAVHGDHDTRHDHERHHRIT